MANSTLREKLILAQKTSGFDSQQPFVTAGDIKEIMSESAVEGELRAHLGLTTQEEIDLIRDFITRPAAPAKRIFAILVYSRQTSKIRDFMQHTVHDGKLPIKIDKMFFAIIDDEVISTYKDYLVDQPTFSSWSYAEILEFYNNQWRFNAPIFYRSFLEDEFPHFPRQTIFAFDVEGRPKGTPFSKVWKIRINIDHIGDLKHIDGFMALKETALEIDHVRQQVQASAVNEIETLKKISQFISSDDNLSLCELQFGLPLTELNTAFYRDDKAYMLLPWADGGNLYELWYGDQHRQGMPVEWIEYQTEGLLFGVYVLHLANSCHGDLKPDNILVFRRKTLAMDAFQWHLRIADFGLARVFEHGTQSRKHTMMMSGAQRYEPPEANRDHPDSDKPRSRQYDIWSLGCIFLELIIWKCFERKGLKEFNERLGDRRVEKFWKRDSTGTYVVHPVVEDWIRKTRDRIGNMHLADDEEKDRHFLFVLLDLVENGMLRIEVDREKIGDTENCRRTARQCTEKLLFR